MASTLPPRASLAAPPVVLIPWDPSSPDHVQRLFDQRLGCGWGEDLVEGMRASHMNGDISLQWVVLDPSHPLTSSLNTTHTTTFPAEASPLQDTALILGGKPRTPPSQPQPFIPIGHISLSHVPKHYAEYGENSPGAYWIAYFYISRALQGKGLGRATMDTVEGIATAEPLCATVLGLNAIKGEDAEMEVKWKALGLELPPFTNQSWYERRGYELYHTVEKLFSKEDKTGKMWYFDAVFMRKRIAN